jgi:hypothetical protein
VSDQVFVVMQVGADGSPERKRADDIYKYVIEPVLREQGLKPYRADLDPSPGSITPKLLSELLNSKAVIADLTGRNPNVYYELGIAHSFARPLICIADNAKSLPFDAKDERIIPLGNYAETGLTMPQGEEAKKKLRTALEIVVAEDYVPPTPLREVAGTQRLDEMAPDNPLVSELETVRELCEQILKRVIPRRILPTGVREDIDVMRRLIETLVAEGVLEPEAIVRLTSDECSKSQTEWVRDVLVPTAQQLRQKAAAQRHDHWGSPTPHQADRSIPPWEEPTPTDPWAKSTPDEAPF